jgi:hypothetical protein
VERLVSLNLCDVVAEDSEEIASFLNAPLRRLKKMRIEARFSASTERRLRRLARGRKIHLTLTEPIPF